MVALQPIFYADHLADTCDNRTSQVEALSEELRSLKRLVADQQAAWAEESKQQAASLRQVGRRNHFLASTSVHVPYRLQ